LLFAGARELFDSYWGQRQAREQWEVGTREVSPDADLGPALARMSIPRLSASWFVFEGIGHKQLRLGPAHMRGTALPGARGNCIIAGHRDTHFRVLREIQKGDRIVLNTRSGEFVYEVKAIHIVSPKNKSALEPTRHAVMNLITCYPFYYVGPAPKRFVVEAELAQAS